MGSIAGWEHIVAEKRALRDKALKPYIVDDLGQRTPRVHSAHLRTCFDDKSAMDITDIDNIRGLLERLRTKVYTAEQVIKAYIQR
jgi:hypothetical protein